MQNTSNKNVKIKNTQMKKLNIKSLISYCKYGLLGLIAAASLFSCTKIGKGYIAPGMLYLTSTFTISQGIVSSSYGLDANGTSTPYRVKWTHIYDSAGNIVDTIFTKKYPIGIWTSVYNPQTDTSFAAIMKKRATVNYPPITLDSTSGIFTTTPASLFIPVGIYSVDMQVTNAEGTVNLPKAMYFNVQATQPLQTTPQEGAYSLGLLIANTASGASFGVLFNGNNNPFVVETINRYADTPNLFILKVLDKNGVVFNASEGQFVKRPNSGLNPNPPYLPNLQDYAPDTFNEPDSGTLNLLYPLVPFPLASIADGYNMYYRIPTAYAHIDSTTKGWVGNPAGSYYQGTSDPHFLGYFKDGLYDYSVRVPMRIFVPGAYELTVKLLNVSHR